MAHAFSDYDQWKLASPDDEYPYDDESEDQCDHSDYETDVLTGRAFCTMCDASWYRSEAELRAEQDRFAAYHIEMDRLNRLEWWRRIWDRATSIFRWRRKPTPTDDDIPF